MTIAAPVVQPFHHADSGTWSYVVSDPRTNAAAIIDPVLDFDPKSGRTATTSAQALLDHIRAHGLQVQWLLDPDAVDMPGIVEKVLDELVDRLRTGRPAPSFPRPAD